MPARTRDLSLHGCFVTSPSPFGAETRVRITIVHGGSKLIAFGRVVFTSPEGMGIAFTKLRPGDQTTLEHLMSGLHCRDRIHYGVEKAARSGEIRAFIDRLKPEWHSFLEQLAYAQFPQANPVGWRADDEAWRDTYRVLDCIAAAYVSWQGSGKAMPDWGFVDDERLAELVQPYLQSQADQSLFLATCRNLMAAWQKLKHSGS